MAYETILYDAAGGLAVITLNRPDKLNAFTRQMHKELQDALRTVERDQAVRCVVFTGAGKGFCAGQDLGDLGAGHIGDVVRSSYNPLIQRIRSLEKIVLAAINGPAAGAGWGLALACDLRVASERASFSTAFVKIGLVPDSAVSYQLPRLAGFGKALELALLSDKLTAAEAERLGLVNRVLPEGEFEAGWRAWADRLAAGPRAQGLIKRMMYRSLHQTMDEQLEYEAWFQEVAGASADAREGIQSFLEKRAPNFRNQ